MNGEGGKMEITKRKTLTGSRYLSFVLNEEEYGIEILKIKEIMGMTDITAIPQTPPFIKGVINLRGKIIPIIDLRLKFEMEDRPYTDRTCIIVVEIMFEGEINLMGVVVDSIQEVINIPEDKISEVPYINAKVKSEYIQGIVMIRDAGQSKVRLPKKDEKSEPEPQTAGTGNKIESKKQ
jgi:purine-binding chemotaxis protein CheW